MLEAGQLAHDRSSVKRREKHTSEMPRHKTHVVLFNAFNDVLSISRVATCSTCGPSTAENWLKTKAPGVEKKTY